MMGMRTACVCALFLLATPLAAQVTGGSEPRTRPVTEDAEEDVQSDYEAMFQGRSFTRIGTASPTGNYGRMPSQTGYVYFNSDAIEPVFEKGVGATSGFFIEGTRSGFPPAAFLPIVLPVGHLGIGYELAYSLSYVNIDWGTIYGSESNPWDEFEVALGEFLTDVRVGPVVSFSPMPGLFLNSSFKLGLGAGLGSYTEFWNYPLTSGRSVDVVDSMAPAFGLARSFGLDVQFTRFSVGWEWNSTSLDRTRTHTLDFSDGDHVEFEYQVDVPVSTSRLFLGIDF